MASKITEMLSLLKKIEDKTKENTNVLPVGKQIQNVCLHFFEVVEKIADTLSDGNFEGIIPLWDKLKPLLIELKKFLKFETEQFEIHLVQRLINKANFSDPKQVEGILELLKSYVTEQTTKEQLKEELRNIWKTVCLKTLEQYDRVSEIYSSKESCNFSDSVKYLKDIVCFFERLLQPEDYCTFLNKLSLRDKYPNYVALTKEFCKNLEILCGDDQAERNKLSDDQIIQVFSYEIIQLTHDRIRQPDPKNEKKSSFILDKNNVKEEKPPYRRIYLNYILKSLQFDSLNHLEFPRDLENPDYAGLTSIFQQNLVNNFKDTMEGLVKKDLINHLPVLQDDFKFLRLLGPKVMEEQNSDVKKEKNRFYELVRYNERMRLREDVMKVLYPIKTDSDKKQPEKTELGKMNEIIEVMTNYQSKFQLYFISPFTFNQIITQKGEDEWKASWESKSQKIPGWGKNSLVDLNEERINKLAQIVFLLLENNEIYKNNKDNKTNYYAIAEQLANLSGSIEALPNQNALLPQVQAFKKHSDRISQITMILNNPGPFNININEMKEIALYYSTTKPFFNKEILDNLKKALENRLNAFSIAKCCKKVVENNSLSSLITQVNTDTKLRLEHYHDFWPLLNFYSTFNPGSELEKNVRAACRHNEVTVVPESKLKPKSKPEQKSKKSSGLLNNVSTLFNSQNSTEQKPEPKLEQLTLELFCIQMNKLLCDLQVFSNTYLESINNVGVNELNNYILSKLMELSKAENNKTFFNVSSAVLDGLPQLLSDCSAAKNNKNYNEWNATIKKLKNRLTPLKNGCELVSDECTSFVGVLKGVGISKEMWPTPTDIIDHFLYLLFIAKIYEIVIPSAQATTILDEFRRISTSVNGYQSLITYVPNIKNYLPEKTATTNTTIVENKAPGYSNG